MAGTKAGGLKAAATNKTKYGKDFYVEIGRKGGRNGHTGGFAANPELAKRAGIKGGMVSSRLDGSIKLSLEERRRRADLILDYLELEIDDEVKLVKKEK